MNLRTVIFWMHLITGLAIGSVIFVIAVSGMMIAFQPQIVAFAERGMRRVEAGTERKTAAEIVASAVAFRSGKTPTGIGQEADPHAAAIVFFGKDGGVFVNPYTGQALGMISPVHDFLDEVIEFHRFLGSPKTGKPVGNACVLAFFMTILGGLFLWWPQQWNASVRRAILFLNPSLQGKAKDWNWHNVIGVWCFPLLFVTSLTGIAMAYTWANNLLFRAVGSEPPPMIAPSVSKPAGTRSNSKADFDVLWNAAASQVKDWQLINLRLGREGAPATAYIVEAGAKPFMRSQLVLEPETGAVKKWEPYMSQSAGKKLRSWILPVHTGQAWGILGQILMATGAFGATLLVWTGFSLSWRRFFQKNSFSSKN